jgi:glycosyltransferase involved in cell wall biosynthesis
LSKKKGLVHIDNELGHRKAYLELFVDLLDLTPSKGEISNKNRLSLINARVLLFATVGKYYKRHLIICIIRSVLFKPTVSLFLGVGNYGKSNRSRLPFSDYVLLKIWKSLPKQKVLSILPYHIDKSSEKFTNGYIYDPQLWDMSVKDMKSYLPVTELSVEAKEQAKGRRILIFLGKITLYKSFDYLVDFAKNNKEDLFVTVAGRMTKECEHLGEKLKELGMLVVNRFISDEELFSLYAAADFAWSYYKPEYDQSSGIFGRAIQSGVIPIIREDSTISKLSESIGCEVIALDKDKLLRYKVSDEPVPSKSFNLNKSFLAQIRNISINTLKSGLELKG